MSTITSFKLNHLNRLKIKLSVCSELFKSMIHQKDIFELISLIEVIFTSPFNKKNELTFYEFSSFYSRFFRSNESILSLIHRLHISTYRSESFTLKSLMYEYESEVIRYRKIRENLKGNMKSIRLTLPIESLMTKVSENLPRVQI